VEPRNPELDARILADGDELEPYRVYADWLTQQGHPRGELIAIQLRLELPGGDRNSLRDREAELLALPEIGGTWLPRVRCIWRRGFVREVRMRRSNADPLLVAVAHPSCRFLRKVRIVHQGDLSKVVRGLLHGAPALQSLGVTAGEVDLREARAPDSLRHLAVRAARVRLGQLVAPGLEELDVGAAEAPDLAVVSAPKLATLSAELALWMTGDAAALVEAAGERFPVLRRLRLYGCERGEEVIRQLADSSLLARLERVTLDFNREFATPDAEALREEAARFSHLASFDIHRAQVDQAVEAELADALPHLTLWRSGAEPAADE
jgi:uncharacterized protein (TIGR02996 family)